MPAVFEAALMIDVVAVAVLAVDEVLAAVAKLAAVAELVAGAKLAAVAELAVAVVVAAAGIVVADKLVADVERVVDLAAVAGAQSFASAAACAFVGTPCTAVAVVHVLDTVETAGCCYLAVPSDLQSFAAAAVVAEVFECLHGVGVGRGRWCPPRWG